MALLAFNEGSFPEGWSLTGGDSSSVSQNIEDFENIPPLAKAFYVRKLPEKLTDGSNLQMQIEYYADPAIAHFPEKLPVYTTDDGAPVAFYDDGTNGGDSLAGDLRYSAYVKEDVALFLKNIAAREKFINDQLPFSYYVGRTVQTLEKLDTFDVEGFQKDQTVPLNAFLIHAQDCGQNILKQNSLFITDLSVVEDPARTYNIYNNTGNPVGAWTFGTLIKNMANTPVTGVSAKAFLKSWVKHWTTDFIVNGNVEAESRPDVMAHLIRPWLEKCGGLSVPHCPAPIGSDPINPGNWECIWDNPLITEANLLKYAPFKLTAIVNRVDLIGNTGYVRNLRNSGETRFIFSLINPATGRVPAHLDPESVDRPAGSGSSVCPDLVTLGSPPIPTIDWDGLNVILEYNNPQTHRCDVRSFMQGWLDLSAYPLPTNNIPNSDFNDALEALTSVVTGAGATPTAPNGSAIGRIRTNERLFSDHLTVNVGPGFPQWSHLDWEFRQFEINPVTHLLEQKPLFNTPKDIMMNFVEGGGGMDDNGFTAPASGDPDVANWIRQHHLRVALGTHSLPAMALSYLARVRGEFMHYSEIDWKTMNQTFGSNYPYPANFRKLRHQYSLQTCQGCHNGETKTFFTHVLPRGYGEPANYWKSTPDHFSGAAGLDSWPKENMGVTQLPGGGTVKNLPIPCGERTFPVVSAFITGRNYGGLNAAPGTFEDDNPNNTATPIPKYPADPDDNTLEGFFYTNDPFNSCASLISSTDPDVIDDMRGRHNDLNFRRDKLCEFLNRPCKASELAASLEPRVFDIMRVVNVVPLPRGSH